ncbi:hypothetical protein [Pseudomonas chlororaphis]|uniref:hypothetical protein n=1 Tax=Pseudomonas chlororaphis TaxID=587753 RepID=UPI0016792FE0|nr:hypothetical protein [Pseudomonas chlororaphis]
MLSIVFQGDKGGDCQAASRASFAPTGRVGLEKQAIKNPEGEPSGFFVLRLSG